MKWLLFNGGSSRRSASDQKAYSHDIVRLYADVKTLAGALLPDNLAKPTDLDIYHWSYLTPEQFMEHLHRNGNADNRYLIYGCVTRSQDLHMLDAMVFAIRRLICRLEVQWLARREPEAPAFTNREMLARQLQYFGRLFTPLDDPGVTKLIMAAIETAQTKHGIT